MKTTVGKIVSDLSQKTPDSRDPIELQREIQKNYMNDLLEAVDRGYKKYNNNFFVCVETKKEPLLNNTFRQYFIDRLTCPTPNYDQSVFRYNREDSKIEYIWTIPDRETCFTFLENKDKVKEKELLYFVLKFADGSLFKLCKKYNNEEIKTPKIIKD